MRANHQLESRMRETRLSGSEGGAAQQCAVPTPIGDLWQHCRTSYAAISDDASSRGLHLTHKLCFVNLSA